MQVSVVIPAYNEEANLGKCLEGVMAQTIKPDEVIVVNNNSTDKTAKIARSFGVNVINEKNKGTIYARNTGFDLSKYDIIARTDADSIPEKTWIAEILKYFKTHKKSAAMLGSLVYEGVPHNLNAIIYKQFIITHQLALGHIPLIGPNMVMKNDYWKKVRPFLCEDDNIVHEDLDVAIHLYQLGGKIGYAPNAVVHTSARRIFNNPSSFFLEYPLRTSKMLRHHNIKLVDMARLKKNSKEIPKKIQKYIAKKIKA
jgi:glycosyltransferase involved in cell wall biosynthesis